MLIIGLILLIFIHHSQEKASSLSTWKNADYRELNPLPFDVISEVDSQRGLRIMYGSAAKAGQFKEYVLMFIKRPSTTVQCGGCLISPKWVMTAKHCTNSAISIDLRFGVTNRNYYDQKTYAIALAQATDVDMSLILLQNAIRVTTSTKPAQLPLSTNDLYTDQIVTACGLGLENQQYNLVSSYLQYVRLKVLPNSDGAKVYGASIVNGNVMCTVGSSEIGNALASTCSGDSGSPIFATVNGIITVVGVVSFGASRCDQGYPTCHVRVSTQLDFIKQFLEL